MSSATLRRAVRETVSGLPREFWWLWTSTLVNRLGAFVATFMALYLTLDRGYSASYAGLVVALHGLGGVISSLGAGVMTDRLGRRPTLLIAQSSTALSVALLGFMHDPVAIAAVAFLVGMASNASRPAVQAMMADIVRPEDRVRAFSLNYWAINLGFAVSSMAAGFIAESSYLAGFLIEAAMTMACAILVFVKLPESRPERTAVEKAAEEVGLGTVLRDGRFMSVVGLSFLVAMVFQQGSVGLPVAMGEAGFTPAEYGLAIAVNGVLIVVLQIPVTRFIQHRDPRRLLGDLLRPRRIRLRPHRLRRIGRRDRAHRLRVDPRRDRQRAHPDRHRRTALPRPRARALPGHVHHVVGRRRARRPPGVRIRHRPVRRRVAVGDVRGRRDRRRARVRAAHAAAAPRGDPGAARPRRRRRPRPGPRPKWPETGAHGRAYVSRPVRHDGEVRAAHGPLGPPGWETRMPDESELIFVSHAERDDQWAQWTAWHLEQAGYRGELGLWHWRAGDDFVTRMNEALEQASAVVAVLSPHYFEPGRYTEEQWRAAVARGGRFIPVVVEPLKQGQLPAFLSSRIQVDLHELPDEAEAVKALTEAVRGRGRPEHPPAYPPTAASGPQPRFPAIASASAVWEVRRRRNPHFTGRDDVIADLRDKLVAERHAAVQALHGTGGIGKTQVALEYVYRFREHYDIVWWIDAEQADQIPVHYAELAARVGAGKPDAGVEFNARYALDHLRSRERWLIVLDNAEEPERLEAWLPDGPGHVLITSRNPGWKQIVPGLPLGVFSRAESLAYLRGQLPSLAEEQATALAEALGDLPLALAQAAGALGDGMPVDQYLRVLETNTAQLLDHGKVHDYRATLAATVTIAMERLEADHPDATAVLRLAALLGPEPIPTAWLVAARDRLATVHGDPGDFRWPLPALHPLARYGLAVVSPDAFQVHRLTQAVVRDGIAAGLAGRAVGRRGHLAHRRGSRGFGSARVMAALVGPHSASDGGDAGPVRTDPGAAAAAVRRQVPRPERSTACRPGTRRRPARTVGLQPGREPHRHPACRQRGDRGGGRARLPPGPLGARR
ncbi:Multidrug resistance protein MdtH [Streptomyces glaucescens]